jgi:hypothetical protein
MRKSELASHFNPALFIPELKATDKEAVLKELLDLFVKEKSYPQFGNSFWRCCTSVKNWAVQESVKG